MTDLDLAEIRDLLAQPHNFHLRLAADKLLTEVERLRGVLDADERRMVDVAYANAEVLRLKRLLGPPDMPTVDSYESMAAALDDERAAVVEHCNRIEELETLLAEILGTFGSPRFAYGPYAIRSNAVPPETLDRWRSHLGRAS